MTRSVAVLRREIVSAFHARPESILSMRLRGWSIFSSSVPPPEHREAEATDANGKVFFLGAL